VLIFVRQAAMTAFAIVTYAYLRADKDSVTIDGIADVFD
jgi:hypothetical protein